MKSKKKRLLELAHKANRRSRVRVQRLVGRVGEFTNAQGRVCQCRVTGTLEPPFDDLGLEIEYVTPQGNKVTGAFISAADFRCATPNAELCHAAIKSDYE